VRAKVFGENALVKNISVVDVEKSIEDKVGRHLLQDFEEESDEEEKNDGETQARVSLVLMHAHALKEKKNKTWGPVQASRMSSRIQRN
jgi:hypothetical protein